MRVLVTTTGGAGHVGPLVPFIEALRQAGDEVLVATRESMAAPVRAGGHEVRTFADAPAELRGPIFASVRGLTNDEANTRVVSEIFAGLDARAAVPGILDACAAFRPHLVMSEVCEFAGPLVAGHLRLPVVGVGIGLSSMELLVMPAVRPQLRAIRADLGLASSSGAQSYFTLTPPAMEDPAAPGPPDALRFREPDAPVAPLPDWWNGSSDPLVYVTFGSVAPQMEFFPAIYRSAIDALAPLPARLLVTIGRDREPADLGPLPPNVHVERWVPQADVMPHAAAMVCHGGFGTVRAGLASGMPMAVAPLFADQPYNAQRVAELGAGIALGEGPAAIAGMRDAVRALLADRSYADRAAAVAADTRALPTADASVPVMHDLAAAVAR